MCIDDISSGRAENLGLVGFHTLELFILGWDWFETANRIASH